jgi:hypothetical protein
MRDVLLASALSSALAALAVPARADVWWLEVKPAAKVMGICQSDLRFETLRGAQTFIDSRVDPPVSWDIVRPRPIDMPFGAQANFPKAADMVLYVMAEERWCQYEAAQHQQDGYFVNENLGK